MRQPPINLLKEVQSDPNSFDNEFLHTVSSEKTSKVNVKMCGRLFKAITDTSATINVIDLNTYEKISGIELRKTNTKAFAYTAV